MQRMAIHRIAKTSQFMDNLNKEYMQNFRSNINTLHVVGAGCSISGIQSQAMSAIDDPYPPPPHPT